VAGPGLFDSHRPPPKLRSPSEEWNRSSTSLILANHRTSQRSNTLTAQAYASTTQLRAKSTFTMSRSVRKPQTGTRRIKLDETVFTPFFMRFWLLEYYEDFDLPRERGVRPRAQVTKEQILKLYCDFAKGAGNGSLLPGRASSLYLLRSRLDKPPLAA